MASELLPCPFCGGIPMIKADEFVADVVCRKCKASTATEIGADHVADAIARWNTRATAPDDAAMRRVVEAARDAADAEEWTDRAAEPSHRSALVVALRALDAAEHAGESGEESGR